MTDSKTLLAITTLVNLHCLVGNRAGRGGDRISNCCRTTFVRSGRNAADYCEKTDKELVVAFVVMVLVMSVCSTTPADRVTTSRLYGLVVSVTENVVADALMLPLGVTLLPLTLR